MRWNLFFMLRVGMVLRLEEDASRLKKFQCTELYPPSSRPTAMVRQLNS